MEHKKTNFRSEWIDVGRILATISIVYFHLPSSAFSSGGISEHVDAVTCLAFFFFFAGYFARPNAPVRRLVGKALALLVPFIVWNLLCIPGLRDELTWQRVFGYGAEGVCCDYPLWFCRDLVLLILMTPLFRSWGWYVCFGLALLFLCLGGWHCGWLEIVRFPTPGNVMLYMTGIWMNRFPPERMEAMFARWWWAVILLWLAGLVLHKIHMLPDVPMVDIYLFPLLKVAGLLLCALGVKYLLPRMAMIAPAMASTCFFVYVMHAPAIILAGELTKFIAPDYLNNPFLLALIPLVIAGMGVVSVALLRQLSPHVLLPILAHEGKLPLIGKYL